MQLYHYTNINALRGILQKDAPLNQELCFWATRFDCFEDKEEFRYGIEYTRKHLMEWEEQNNIMNRIGQEIDADKIIASPIVPKPYIISMSMSATTDKMWEEYAAENKGVVLDLNFDNESLNIISSTNMQGEIKGMNCLYDCPKVENLLKTELIETYNMCSKRIYDIGIKDTITFNLLLISGLLYFFCPQIKRKEYDCENEYRLVWSVLSQDWYNVVSTYLKEFGHTIEQFIQSLNTCFPAIGMPQSDKEMKQHINKEKVRDKNVFYREIFMPKSVLKSILVKDKNTYDEVIRVLSDKHFTEMPIQLI